MIMVAWDNVCKPKCELGLGLKRFKDINRSMLMKLAWGILIEDGIWAKYMRGKYFNRVGEIMKKSSTLWRGLKEALKLIEDHSHGSWANRKGIHLWKDRWAVKSVLRFHSCKTHWHSRRIREYGNTLPIANSRLDLHAKPSRQTALTTMAQIPLDAQIHPRTARSWGGRFYIKASTMMEA
ncbi:hypothetical protein IFM89_024056 [Coptis chinensis]|uniref:Uncharacterized protein n=1 Tax=Coptis chinensis TaxID=261450 RepID=A0A835LST6_9MAGN|nr:hypothetical protein IFM89_024056 [Coptis chinensis]